jgi:putative ABC transport system substrate-binding protein
MQRREFITLLGGATAAWPLAALAQPERLRRIDILRSTAEDDPDTQTRITAFLQGLQQLGWTEGRNVRINTRWGASDPDRIRGYVAELTTLAPDIIVAIGAATLGPVLQATRAVPIVFVTVPDPVGAGFVETVATRPALRSSNTI